MRLKKFAQPNYGVAAEANRRLSGCIVLVDDRPVSVGEVSTIRNVPTIRYRKEGDPNDPYNGWTADGGYYSIPLDDPSVNVFDIPLGYMNTSLKEAIYVTRHPVRGQRQGLQNNGVSFSPSKTNPFVHYNVNSAVREPGFTEMVQGRYPTFDEARERVMKGEHSVAFSRRLALQQNARGFPMYLMYRGEQIGWGVPEKGPFELPKEYAFLREQLQEAKAI